MNKSLVLVFHKEENGPLFEKVIIALKKRYNLVSADELADILLQRKEPENICHISFDDGERSFYDIIFPLLVKHQVPVSLFVSPYIISSGENYWFQETADFKEEKLKKIQATQLNIELSLIKKFSTRSVFKCLPIQKIKEIISAYCQIENCRRMPPQNINADQLRELDASGLVTIGAHTINHPILKNETNVISQYEISESVEQLESLLGHAVGYFAYPNGRHGIDFDEREIKYLGATNIKLAFSAELNHISSTTNPLCIPRMSFARMGLSPYNPLVQLRMNLGKKWIDIKSFGKPAEHRVRSRIKKLISPSLIF